MIAHKLTTFVLGAFRDIERVRTHVGNQSALIQLLRDAHRAGRAPEELVAFSLFGDASGAVVIEAQPEESCSLASLGPMRTRVDRSGRDLVRWDLTAEGFKIALSRQLPGRISEAVLGFVSPLVRDLTGDQKPSKVRGWCLHPGGAAILRETQRALGLPDAAMDSTFRSLKHRGNTSSAAILGVLEEEIRSERTMGDAILLGVGPGLSLEALAIRKESSLV